MLGIFLVHRGACFELTASGSLRGETDARSIRDAISYLPDGCAALIDLRSVTVVDATCANAIVGAVRERHLAGTLLAIVARGDSSSSMIVESGLVEGVALYDNIDDACRSLLALT